MSCKVLGCYTRLYRWGFSTHFCQYSGQQSVVVSFPVCDQLLQSLGFVMELMSRVICCYSRSRPKKVHSHLSTSCLGLHCYFSYFICSLQFVLTETCVTMFLEFMLMCLGLCCWVCAGEHCHPTAPTNRRPKPDTGTPDCSSDDALWYLHRLWARTQTIQPWRRNRWWWAEVRLIWSLESEVRQCPAVPRSRPPKASPLGSG